MPGANAFRPWQPNWVSGPLCFISDSIGFAGVSCVASNKPWPRRNARERSSRSWPDGHLRRLLSQVCSGELNPAQMRQLLQLLESSEAVRDCYVQYVSVHAELMWRFSGAG